MTDLDETRAAVLNQAGANTGCDCENCAEARFKAALAAFERAVREDQYAFVVAALIPQQTSCGGGWATQYVEAGEPCPSAHVCLGWVEDAFGLRELEAQA